MQPTGMVEVNTVARMDGKLELFGYGGHDRAINPGDLVIVCTQYLQENLKNQEIVAIMKIRGRDMNLFVDKALEALKLYRENESWLTAPSSRRADFVEEPARRLPIQAIHAMKRAENS